MGKLTKTKLLCLIGAALIALPALAQVVVNPPPVKIFSQTASALTSPIFTGTVTFPDGATWTTAGQVGAAKLGLLNAAALVAVNKTGTSGALAQISNGGTNGNVRFGDINGVGDNTDLFATGAIVARLTGGTNRFSFTGGTDPTIGTSGGNLNLSSTVVLSSVTTGTNADFLCLSSGGVVLLQTSACTISSRRFKYDIDYISDSRALSDVLKMRPVAFNMKGQESNPDNNAGRRQVGLIAEDVAAIDARLAIYEPDGLTPKSYRQEAVIADLVGAIKAQQHEIDALKRELKRSKR